MKKLYKSSLNCPPDIRNACLSIYSKLAALKGAGLAAPSASFSGGSQSHLPPATCHFGLRLSEIHAWIPGCGLICDGQKEFTAGGGGGRCSFSAFLLQILVVLISEAVSR